MTQSQAAHFRYTVVDGQNTVSFLGRPHLLKVFVAVCGTNPGDWREMLRRAAALDDQTPQAILRELDVFDEHNVDGDSEAFERLLEAESDRPVPSFRVINELTRNMSLEPDRLGLVLFNLAARRIIQVQNNYGELRRRDRVRKREGGRATGTYCRYTLPDEWTLLPEHAAKD